MSKRIEKAALITNFNIYDKAKNALEVARKLASCGCEVITSFYNKDKIEKMGADVNITYVSNDKIYRECDAVVVLGGDGTILESARRSAPLRTPIIGINLGRIGYMAELETGEIDALERVVNGDYEIEERSMLSVEIIAVDGHVRSSNYALNDAVLSNGSISRIVDLELSEGGVLISSYRSDGIIIATPTGSTAYSMSAGGAVVDPRLSCICVTPICPHSLSARPLVFPDSATIAIKNVCQREKMLYLTVDGRANFELFKGESVQITRSPLTTRFIKLNQSGFYIKLRQKMNEK
ncbi:MAG: NAD(+)/NADH kinase [Ruminococcaceae bacterium]|nr:NAD(+)/NADH kinase [Oscillospiraceae bacterium]